MAWFEAQNLILKTHDGRKLSKVLKFTIDSGEVIHIQGANGTGKTTLIKALLGLHQKFSGKLKKDLKPDQIAYLPQLTNYEFFLPLTFRDLLSGIDSHFKSKLSDYLTITDSWLDLSWNKASGGERQKVLILKTLLLDRPLLILDEPFNHLDKEGREQIKDWIEVFLKTENHTLIIIHHGDLKISGRKLKVLELEGAHNA